MTFQEAIDHLTALDENHPVNPSSFASKLDPIQVKLAKELLEHKKLFHPLRPRQVPISRWITIPRAWPVATSLDGLRIMDHNLQQLFKRARIFFLDFIEGIQSRVTHSTKGLFFYMKRFARYMPAFMDELFPDRGEPNSPVETVGNAYAYMANSKCNA